MTRQSVSFYAKDVEAMKDKLRDEDDAPGPRYANSDVAFRFALLHTLLSRGVPLVPRPHWGVFTSGRSDQISNVMVGAAVRMTSRQPLSKTPHNFARRVFTLSWINKTI